MIPIVVVDQDFGIGTDSQWGQHATPCGAVVAASPRVNGSKTFGSSQRRRGCDHRRNRPSDARVNQAKPGVGQPLLEFLVSHESGGWPVAGGWPPRVRTAIVRDNTAADQRNTRIFMNSLLKEIRTSVLRPPSSGTAGDSFNHQEHCPFRRYRARCVGVAGSH